MEASRDLERTEHAISFNDVFSTRKPKNVQAGLASGLKSVAKGVAAGAAGLVVAPAVGAVQGGLPGFAKGCLSGLAGAVLLPVTGVAVGATQVVRGIANTPEAIRESSKGRFWDEDAREWTDQPTLALAVDNGVFNSARQRWQQEQGGRKAATDYYALLGVARDASPDEIKKQYYTLARRMHPDKNPEDPLAKERFQRMSEAYQVLGTPELRARYDQHGTEGLDVNFMDGAEFFSMLFGSDSFEHLVGELMIAAAARNGGDLSAGQMKKLQIAREERLAVLLNALLRRWVEGDQEGFKESMQAEAAGLVMASYGSVLVKTIGRVYESQAEIFLGGLVDGTLAAMRSKGQSVKSQFAAASLALKVFQAQSQMEKLDREFNLQKRTAAAEEQPTAAAAASTSGEANTSHADAGPSPHSPGGGRNERTAFLNGGAQGPAVQRMNSAEHLAERARLEEAALPLMLEAMWAANVLDIESTLRHVARKVLHDPFGSKEVRRSRALALQQLGRIFQAAVPLETPAAPGQRRQAPHLAKQQMEDAMQRVLEKRHAADDARHQGGAS
ncbi:hypothetical protein WJX72_001695 [[Myrmecia] bisecta]|uniref:J domain-containing protein n=1 Tax=[Myrmecia] bisecta TaxID=41462 RepID=A0AAW1PP00_9CHLO